MNDETEQVIAKYAARIDFVPEGPSAALLRKFLVDVDIARGATLLTTADERASWKSEGGKRAAREIESLLARVALLERNK